MSSHDHDYSSPLLERAHCKPKSIGILTSGGDAQGMNAAVRAVVRKTIWMGSHAYAIMNGYQGMVDDHLVKLSWEDVGGKMHEGGTFIGTARCMAFMKREGRKIAAKNLLKNNIDRLVIIGGDGSLTGAHYLSKEWPELVKEVIADRKAERLKTVTDPKALREGEMEDERVLREHSHLTIVGLVGSIDNDMCGTEMTIGAATALTRIIDAVDSISSTAASHQRDFVVEVMGRNCGWLALMGALATGSDYVMIPENPQPEDWKKRVASIIRRGKEIGKRAGVVILAEGAKDTNGKLIKSSDVKEALDEAGFEARITILGHVQRGGSPVAYDRIMSTWVGAKAAEMALADTNNDPCFVGVLGNRIAVSPLTECLEKTRSIATAIGSHDYDKAMQMRSHQFAEGNEVVNILTSVDFTSPAPSNTKKLRIAIMHVGACSPGMNSAVRAAVRIALNSGHTLLGVKNGFEGLVSDGVSEMNWMSVNGWARQGGAFLGVRRFDPKKLDYKAISEALQKHKINAFIMIGGWDGYECFIEIHKRKQEFPAFQIPVVLIPASISNNLPYSEHSIGDDTALNNVLDAVDKIKESAVSTSRVFVVEVMGSSGYLALATSIASGAEVAYLPEDKVSLPSLQRDIDALVGAFKHKQHRGLIINNEEASSVFTTQTLANLYEEQSEGLFSARSAILGHLQQGGAPTGLDRILASTLAYHAVRYLEKQANAGTSETGAIGTVLGKVTVTPVAEVVQEMDKVHRRGKHQWWLEWKELQKVYGLIYDDSK